jgi:hypothetical protein
MREFEVQIALNGNRITGERCVAKTESESTESLPIFRLMSFNNRRKISFCD